MKKHYLYPQNMKTSAKLWLWNLRDLVFLGIFLALSVVAWAKLGWVLPAALTGVFGFLSIRPDDTSVLDYMLRAGNYFRGSQQAYEWKEDRHA